MSNVSLRTVLRAESLHKRIGETRALNGVDVEVAAGEIVALFGANGAGKTTLLHLLAGLSAPDRGSIRVAGLDDPTRAVVRKNIGFAPQPTAVYEDLTVEENLAFFARMQGVADVREAVARGVSFARLESRASSRAGTLSGGMRRRLHVAAAIVHRPALLLLDEPTVGIDGDSCAHLIRSLGALKDDGVAIVWSTHDAAHVEALSARSVVLDQGRVS